MLQQTTIAAVTPYFERFLKRFPTVQDLAAAQQAEVLRYWEGLGYYSRARNLHAAAQVIAEESGGEFPKTREQLIELPGIGRYTAAAIASFAFESRVGIVEANTVRLYTRLLNMAEVPTSAKGQRTLWSFADWLASPGKAEVLNQALMDIGSTVCIPQTPNCPTCPLLNSCRAFRAGTQHTLPTAKPRTPPTDVIEACFVLYNGKQILLRQNSQDERWHGLWDFPRIELTHTDWSGNGNKDNTAQLDHWIPTPDISPTDLDTITSRTISQLTEATGYQVGKLLMLHEFHHTVTRYRVRRICVSAEKLRGRMRSGLQLKWCTPEELNSLPMTAPARKLVQHLSTRSNIDSKQS